MAYSWSGLSCLTHVVVSAFTTVQGYTSPQLERLIRRVWWRKADDGAICTRVKL